MFEPGRLMKCRVYGRAAAFILEGFKFTFHQLQILVTIEQYGKKQAAEILNYDQRTVAQHLRNFRDQNSLETNEELVAKAEELDILKETAIERLREIVLGISNVEL
jgi:DNA-binding CsgD family transcriptional regulator